MHSSSRAARPAAAFFLALLFLLTTAGGAFAQATTYLSGIVTAGGTPVGGAAITAAGNNLTLHATTDARGAFSFTAIPIGTYQVDATAAAGTASVRVDLTGSGTTVTLALSHLQEIGRTAVTSRPPVHGSGTDLTLSAENLTRSPANGSLPELLLQLPGAARGANGVVHINGDHGDVNYVVDGVPIPQELNRNIGTEFDPNDIAFVEALQGAYPAQYGERFASVLNISTRTGNGPPGFTGDVQAGSFAHADSTLGYHTNLGPGSLVLAARNERGDRGLDPPNLDSPHNQFSNANQFLRYAMPTGANFLNVTLSHAYRTYQIPSDVAGGQPATTDDNETQDDLFASALFRHPIGDRGSLSFGPSYKRSRIRDFGDPNNDFIYGEGLNPGGPTDCANALTDPTVSYVNGTCAYSLGADRTAIDVGGNLDYVNRSAKHEVAFGALYDATHVSKSYAVTLQPGNFLAPVFTPGTPAAAYTVIDNAPNVGHLAALYLQDTWHMGDWQLDYGARADTFKISSTEFVTGFGQVSPRVKLTKNFGGRNSVYAYYGRFFTPFSLENVSPTAAYALNLPIQPTPAQFDLKPQRDSVYEVGGHFGVGRGDLGVRIMQKNATDLIDDTQIGVTNLHQDINYQLGRIATQTAYYQLGLRNAGRFYFAATHTYSVNKGCETQLLAPCFGAGDDWTPADHDQRWDVTSGLLVNDRHNGWFAIDGEYGSGLSSALDPGAITCGGPDGNSGGPCKKTPHLTFDVEKGFGIAHNVALTLRVRNIFNDQYLVTYLNAQGNHWAAPRTIDVGLRFGR